MPYPVTGDAIVSRLLGYTHATITEAKAVTTYTAGALMHIQGYGYFRFVAAGTYTGPVDEQTTIAVTSGGHLLAVAPDLDMILSYMEARLADLQGQIPVGCHYIPLSSYGVTGGVQAKLTLFNKAVYDDLGEFDATNGRLTSVSGGVYLLDVSIENQTASTSTTSSLSLYKNGSYFRTITMEISDAAASYNHWITGTVLITLDPGDYIEIQYKPNVSTTLGGFDWNQMHIVKLRQT